MEQLLVIPTPDIAKEMTKFSEKLGFDIKKVEKSALGRLRFFLEKEGCQMCFEEYIPEPNMPNKPYLELKALDPQTYSEVAEGICFPYTTMVITNYDPSITQHSIATFYDREGESMPIVVLCTSGINVRDTITLEDNDDAL
jgi:hypothetical protein